MSEKTGTASASVLEEPVDKKTARRLFLAVMITSFMGPFSAAGINVAIPAIGAEFTASATDLSRVVFLYLLGSAIFVLPAGKIADIYGRRRIYDLGTWLLTISTFLCAFAPSIDILNGLRFLQGVVMALIFGPGMALLVSSHPAGERGKVIGYSAAATYSGMSMGPVCCGFLCELLDWRGIFILMGVVIAVSALLMRGIKHEWYGDKGAKIDVKGSLCYLVAAPMLLYGLTEATDGNLGLMMMAAGLAGFLLFAFIELKVQHPCLEFRMFKGNPVLLFSNLASMLHYSSTFALSFLMSLYLQVVMGYSASAAGGILLFQPVVMALLSPKAGALSDRIPPGKVATVGMFMTASGLGGMSLLTKDTPLIMVIGLLMWIGLGFALFSSPNNNAIMGSVPQKYYGAASSLIATMRLFGQSMSMAIVTMVMSMMQVASLTGADNIHLLPAIQRAFMVFAIISVAGIFMSAVRNKSVKEE